MPPKIDYTRYYRKWHDDSPEHLEAMMKSQTVLLAPHLPSPRDLTVLDLGCGMGFTMLALRQLGYTRLCGWDVDAGQVEAARSRNLDVELTEDSIAALARQLSHFDLVLCLDVIEHIPVPQQLDFVHAIFGALKPGGRMIASVPNANSALHGRWRYGDWTHTSSFTEHSLDFLLFNGGFSAISIFPGEVECPPPHPWLPIRGTRNWWLRRAMRGFRRLEMIAEFGRSAGGAIPLSLNLLAVADRP